LLENFRHTFPLLVLFKMIMLFFEKLIRHPDLVVLKFNKKRKMKIFLHFFLITNFLSETSKNIFTNKTQCTIPENAHQVLWFTPRLYSDALFCSSLSWPFSAFPFTCKLFPSFSLNSQFLVFNALSAAVSMPCGRSNSFI
jgi:hypothetical protein